MFLYVVRCVAEVSHKGKVVSVADVSLVVSLQVTKPFFSALGDESVQQKLLSVMFDLLVESRSPLVSNTVGSVFKAVSRDDSNGSFCRTRVCRPGGLFTPVSAADAAPCATQALN